MRKGLASLKRNSGVSFALASAFTLVELLVVIAIIGILASMLLPAIFKVKLKVKITQTKHEITQLGLAIAEYRNLYQKFPTTNVGPMDVTLCCWWNNTRPDRTFPALGDALPSHSDVMMILMDIPLGPNTEHVKNPQRQPFFHSDRTVSDTNSPGFSNVDYQLRDCWGHPYIITFDSNEDGRCRDWHYSRRMFTQLAPNSPVGKNGFRNYHDPSGSTDDYELPCDFMIWSPGPDRGYDVQDPVRPGLDGGFGLDKDNVVSWR